MAGTRHRLHGSKPDNETKATPPPQWPPACSISYSAASKASTRRLASGSSVALGRGGKGGGGIVRGGLGAGVPCPTGCESGSMRLTTVAM